jgi:wyosine [tRNA(Phe)-imidazoG37] synthetase (radical SAM superfamily)
MKMFENKASVWYKIYQRTEEIIEMTLLNTLEIQNQKRGQDQSQDKYINLIENHVVEISLPRRSGTSTSVVKVANKLFKKPLFIYSHQYVANAFANTDNPKGHKCVSIDNFVNNFEYIARGQQYDAIFLDSVWNICSESQRDTLIDLGVRMLHDNYNFIMAIVGEHINTKSLQKSSASFV